MSSHFDAAIARIQEIESRLGMVGEPTMQNISLNKAGGLKSPPAAGASSALGLPDAAATSSAQQPFNLALAQATGNVQLQALGTSGSGGPPFAPYIEALINKYATQNGIAPNLVRAVVRQESDGNPHDVSRAGAKGLMQLMPEEIQQLGVTDPFDPEQNIAAGTRLLSGLLRQYNGDTPLALAAYNAGSGAVKKYNGIPPYAETQNYVKRIMGMVGRP